VKDVWDPAHKEFENVTTLDNNVDHLPDVLWDLNEFPYPFEDNTFDEIHAYEVLEHIGTQGDYRHFFKEFEEYARILKPQGSFFGSTPLWNDMWAWGDPSHTRVINSGSLVFLDQSEYERQIGKTPMSDFRFCYKADLRVAFTEENPETKRYYFRLVNFK
jgi:SAM-dependent methyltransferase